MSLNRIILLILLWIASVMCSFWAGRHFSILGPERGQTTDAPALAQQKKQDQSPSENAAATGIEDLQRENAELKAKLARIQGEREKLGKEYLELTLKQALQDVGKESSTAGDMKTTWEQGFEEFQRHDQRGLGAGLGRGLGLLFDMAQYGEKGIFFLRDIVTDAQRSVRERELALNVLSLMHTKQALRAIMDLRAPDVMELDYPYDLILPQMSSLSTEELAEYIPEINSQIAQDLQGDEIGLAPEKVDVLAYLAFSHNNQDSLNLLCDPNALQENLSTALRLADETHSPQARQYVEVVAGQGKGPFRAQANRMLQAW